MIATGRTVRRVVLLVTVLALALAAPASADMRPGNDVDHPLPPSVYSNGCGGQTGIGPVTTLLNWFLDTARYKDSWYNPLAPTFVVDFRAACDLHDAGHEGGVVSDPINGGVVDFRTWSRRQVDDKFLADLQTLCSAQVPIVDYRWYEPGTSGVALEKCRGFGTFNLAGFLYKGAGEYHAVVRRLGGLFFDAEPAVPGLQRAGPRSNA